MSETIFERTRPIAAETFIGGLEQMRFVLACTERGMKAMQYNSQDGKRSDVNIDGGRRNIRVQVKTARIHRRHHRKHEKDTWRTEIASTNSAYTDKDIDFLVAYVPDSMRWYILPITHIVKYSATYLDLEIIDGRPTAPSTPFVNNWKQIEDMIEEGHQYDLSAYYGRRGIHRLTVDTPYATQHRHEGESLLPQHERAPLVSTVA